MPLFSAICAQCTSSTGANRMSRRSDGSPKYHPVWQSQLKRWIDHGYMDIRYPHASSATRNAPSLCTVNLGILAVTVFRLCFRSWSSVARRNALASPSEQNNTRKRERGSALEGSRNTHDGSLGQLRVPSHPSHWHGGQERISRLCK